jgi:choline dehydrogenase-like flavoprotein
VTVEVREDQVDYVIVGSGAGGATAARVLSEAGRSVLLIEEGASLATDQRPRAMLEALRTTFRDAGSQMTRGRAPFPLLQGCLVGGTTAVNSGITWRLPEDVRAEWSERHGLGELVEEAALTRTFVQIERELSIHETDRGVLGENALLLERAAHALALPGKVIARNTRDCVGSARCLQGCPRAARQSMDVSYVPFSLARGARLWESARVEQIELSARRAVGVRGHMRGGQGADEAKRVPFFARARKGVIIACGALHTPLLLRKAGLRGLVGQRFQAHPGAAVVGVFDTPVVQGFGATQGYEIPLRERGFKVESLSLPPELLAARLPGVGPDWQRRLMDLGHYAHWAAQVRMRAQGSVAADFSGRPRVRFTPLPADMEKVRESVALMVRLFFAAGAREVSHGVHGLPPYFSSPDQAALIERHPADPSYFHMLASHLFGTACAGKDPAHSVVGPFLECHAIKDLFVMDASVFPTNLGVNPQHSIMALAFRAAERLC